MRNTPTQDQPFELTGLDAQRAYVAKLEDEGSHFDLMAAASFVRGMRELGYKSNAHALDELIDNAEQAGAANVHIAFGFTGESDAKPAELAVIDDGHGMDPKMIRAAMMWGGTHRENDRKGFGRFGYGLPSASVSIARRYSVYSWVDGGPGVFGITFDVDELATGKYRDTHGHTVVPDVKRAELPAWVSDYIDDHFPGGMPRSGTVVLLDSLDRLKWKTAKNLREKLVEHIGVTYRNYLRMMNVVVDGDGVEPLDPLFLTPGARFFANDAEGLPPASFEVKDPATGKPLGSIKVRYAYLKPGEFSMKYADAAKKELNKARTAIRDQFNGLLILRNGRQLDVVRTLPRSGGWRKSFKNYDAFYKVEVDFPATLDEEFAVTTSKQQVVLTDRIWDLLKQIGVPRVMTDLYKRVSSELVALHARTEDTSALVGTAEQVMEDIQKFKARSPESTPQSRKDEAERNLQEYIRRRAEGAKLPVQVVEKQYAIESQTKRYVRETENLPGAPFYRVIPRGSQVVLLINEGHRFHDDLYAAFGTSPRLRAALELLLFVIGEAELDAGPERRRFYETERAEWSRVLNTALDRLSELNSAELEADAEEALEAELAEEVTQAG
jgi:hypothetical protein